MIISAVAVALMGFAYCTPKIGKDLTKTQEYAPTAAATFTDEELETGNQLMRTSCAKCHVLFEPKDFTTTEWEEILKSMLPKARLSGRDAELVKAYIMKNARK